MKLQHINLSLKLILLETYFWSISLAYNNALLCEFLAILSSLCWPLFTPQMIGEPRLPGVVNVNVSVTQSPIEPPIEIILKLHPLQNPRIKLDLQNIFYTKISYLFIS
jgi:hypothetical protein